LRKFNCIHLTIVLNPMSHIDLTRKSHDLSSIFSFFNITRSQRILQNKSVAPYRTGITVVTTDSQAMSHTHGPQLSMDINTMQPRSANVLGVWGTRSDGRSEIRRIGHAHVHRANRRRTNDVPARRRSRGGDALCACMRNKQQQQQQL